MRCSPVCASCLVLAWLASGCDVVAPRPAAGVYVLRTVAGAALPAVLYSGVDFGFTVAADTLRLDDDGRGTMSLDGTTWVNASVSPGSDRRELAFTVFGGVLEMSTPNPCPLGVFCQRYPLPLGRVAVGRVDGRRLTIDTWQGERGPQVFERVAGGP